MSTVIKTYVGIFAFILSLTAMAGVMVATMDSNQARDFFDVVITEIEESNFSPSVVQSCMEQANEMGYHLVIDDSRTVKNENGNTVLMEVILKYQYRISFFGIHDEKQIRGFAR